MNFIEAISIQPYQNFYCNFFIVSNLNSEPTTSRRLNVPTLPLGVIFQLVGADFADIKIRAVRV